MRPGTKPKPAYLKLIEANRGKRPLNRKEAKTIPALPALPPQLTAVAAEEWNRVAHWLHRIGLPSAVDRAALAAYALAYGRKAQAERAIAKMTKKDLLIAGLMIETSSGNAIQNPLGQGCMLYPRSSYCSGPATAVRISSRPLMCPAPLWAT